MRPPIAETSPEGWRVARVTCCSAFAVAFDLRLRLDTDWPGHQIIKLTSRPWMWVALVLAFLMIGYVATPPVVMQQAALWSGE